MHIVGARPISLAPVPVAITLLELKFRYTLGIKGSYYPIGKK